MRRNILAGLWLVIALIVGGVAPGCGGRRPTLQRDGGTILVYDVDSEAWQAADESAKVAMTKAVVNRLSQYKNRGVEVSIDSKGQVRAAIPGDDTELLDRIKVVLASQGNLEFLIVANPRDHADLIETARQSDAMIVRAGDKIIGRWVTVGRSVDPSSKELLVSLLDLIIRDAATKGPLEFSDKDVQALGRKRDREEKWLAERGTSEVEALVVVDPEPSLNVGGHHLVLGSVLSSYDESAQPCLNFTMTAEGAELLQRLTSRNLPDASTGTSRQLGIILDGKLLTAPTIQSTISDQGRITGKFTKEEVQTMVGVLRSGGFPFRLSRSPTSETRVKGTGK